MAVTKTVAVDAVRVNCMTGVLKDCQLIVEIYDGEGSLSGERWCRITSGGVTGYESAKIDDLLKYHTSKYHKDAGWHANAGTPKTWDTLYLPRKSVATILRAEGVLQ